MSNLPMIITIAVAVLAAAAVVVLLVVNKGGNRSEEPVIPGFQVTEELANECMGSSQKLVSDNYEIIRLYVTEGLPIKKVYGSDAEPIDGYCEVDSPRYTDFSQIEALVKSVYDSTAADKVLKSFTANAKDGTEKEMEVYKSCRAYGETFLGVNEQFVIDHDYKTDWSSCYVEVKPKSETECDITVYLNGVTSDTAAENSDSVRSTSMVKTADGWRLTKLLK